MEDAKHLKELLELLSSGGLSAAAFKDIGGEKMVEGLLANILALYSEMRQARYTPYRDAEDIKLEQCVEDMREILAKKNCVDDKPLRFNGAVQTLFEKGGLFSDIERHRDEIVENAESWVSVVKGVYEGVNQRSLSLRDDMLFWRSFSAQLAGLRDFSLSEEFMFLSGLLERIKAVKLKHSLAFLFTAEKISRFTEVFCRFYDEISCEFLNSHILSYAKSRFGETPTQHDFFEHNGLDRKSVV